MLGIQLLIVSLLLYKGNKKWSILLFLFFSLQSFYILPENTLGVKFLDLALIYMIIINVYSAIYENEARIYLPYEKYIVWVLLAFLSCSALYSYLHYKYTPFQIIQGGRSLFLFASYFFLRKVDKDDIVWILEVLFYITLAHAALYILQCITNLPVLLVNAKDATQSTGVIRYYNFPMLLPFYLLYCILFPQYFKTGIKWIAIILFVVTIILTQGRTYMITNLAAVLLGFLMQRQMGKITRWLVVGVLVLLPFSNMILSRFEKGNTDTDISQVLNGDFATIAQNGMNGEGTMTFRFSWVAERFLYIKERPLGEKMFGLGMISDSQSDVVSKKYHFNIGLRDKNNNTIQLGTADIAWGNFLTSFGFLGTPIFLCLWCSLLLYLYKLRDLDPYMLCGALFIIHLFLNSIAESHISTPSFLAFPMLLLTFGLALYMEDFYQLDEDQDEYANKEQAIASENI